MGLVFWQRRPGRGQRVLVCLALVSLASLARPALADNLSPAGAALASASALPPIEQGAESHPRVEPPPVTSAVVPDTPTPNTPAIVNSTGDVSKIDGLSPDKLPVRFKVKECCGYPVAQKEGFRLSFYWLAYESEYANEPYDTPIYTRRGFYIGSFPSAFVYELKLEGSGILRDGRVLNYDGECNYGMGTCFKALALSEDPLGAGAQGRPLEPFRSIAVDPRYIPIGSPVFVPELVGAVMPDGSRHDGCLRADDTGGAIKEHKIDFFVESYNNFKFIADNLWWRMKATPLLEEPRCEYLRLGDYRERDNERTDWLALHRNYKQKRMAEKLALRKTARNRAIAKAWLKRHSSHPTGHTALARKR